MFFPPNVCQHLDAGGRFDVPLEVSITSASVSFVQCGKEFVPAHGRTQICSDECRERRAMNRKNGINMTFKRTELKTDAEEVEQEIRKQELAEKFAPRHTRREPVPTRRRHRASS